jgi:hypothetical protein
MSLTINLQRIKCLEEVNEASASEEPYVLVTAADLNSPIPGSPAPPNLRVFRYGIWEDMDEGEVRENGHVPFWGINATPANIENPDDAALIVSLLENDNADPSQYEVFVKAAATQSLISTLGETNRGARSTVLANDIRAALDGVNFPIPFALDDDHVGTTQLKLDSADLVPTGTKEKTVVIRTAEGAYELTFRIKRHAWAEYELSGPGSAARSSNIAAVSRIPGSMELWWVGDNGSVEGAYWYEGFTPQFQRYQIAPPGSAAMSGGITAVSRIPGSMELWWTGKDGSVEAAYWYDGGQWNRYQIAPPGSASTSGGITSVSRIPGSMEIWWTGNNGSVEAAYWYDGGQWNRYQIAPPGSASMSGGITSVSRIPNSMEIWWIGKEGSVEAAYWYEGIQWTRYQIAPPGRAALDGGIASVSRIQNSMEIWWIGSNGSVMDAFWYEGGQWGQFEIANPNMASGSSGIAALSRQPGTMEIWYVGGAGSINDAYWYG